MVALTKFNTQVIFNSTDPGTKTVSIPGSESSNNGFSLDIKTTVGDGSTFLIEPTSGTVGGLPCIQFVDNKCDLALRSNAAKSDWLIRWFNCYEPVPCGSLPRVSDRYGWISQNHATTLGVSLGEFTHPEFATFIWINTLALGDTPATVLDVSVNSPVTGPKSVTRRWAVSYSDLFGTPSVESTFGLELWWVDTIPQDALTIDATLSRDCEGSLLAIPIIGFNGFDSNGGLPFTGNSNGLPPVAPAEIPYQTSNGNNLIFYAWNNRWGGCTDISSFTPYGSGVSGFGFFPGEFASGAEFILGVRSSTSVVSDTAIATGLIPSPPQYISGLAAIDAIR